MKKWLLTCSIDANDIDYTEVIESEKEPSFWKCYDIAHEHGCEWWSIGEIVEDGGIAWDIFNNRVATA